MTVQPIKRQKLTDSVVEELMSLIVRGDMQAGQRLPPERQLAEQMGVSRASVRGALARLEALGHVGVRQGDGIYVQEPSAANLSRPFQGILTRLPQQARDLLEFRRMLEPEVAALAARHATPGQLAELWAGIEQQKAAARQQLKLTREDLQFHALIAQMAGNGVVMLVLETLQELLHDLRDRALVGQYPETTIQDHGTIARAIAASDPTAAHQAMRLHLDHVIHHASDIHLIPEGGTAHA